LILNGAPRSGKSSIVAVIQDTFDGVWMNIGVDAYVMHLTPLRFRPGIGLRPVEPDHPAAAVMPAMYRAMFDAIAAHSRQGLNVVADLGLHETNSPGILRDLALRLAALPVLFIGVRCPIQEIMRRRNEGQAGREGWYAVGTADDPVPEPVRRWQDAVHVPGVYDLEVDTSRLSSQECAERIRTRLRDGPPGTAFHSLSQR
jgi:chloramphenicol 3-O phosphotransferase